MLAAPSIVAAEWEAQACRTGVRHDRKIGAHCETSASLARVSVADPRVADALVLTPRQVYSHG
jgi:hypothetical protein